MIYKICERLAWQAAVESGRFQGAAIDLQDGFIHFSTAAQAVETAARHFAGQHNLLLVEFDENDFGDNLRWEVSRGGDEFPHLYDSLRTDLAKNVYELPLSEDGQHQFPAKLNGQ